MNTINIIRQTSSYTTPLVQRGIVHWGILLAFLFLSSSLKAQHATGIDNGVVYLNDLEDHTWTYYSGVDVGDYKTKYVGGAYNAGKLYSPNPRNVKITYNANGGAVSISEPENKFVYYKTLEQGTNVGEYPYTVISNPFSKRPKVDGKVQGFNGWEIVSGGGYIKDYDNGDVLPLDAEIVFESLPYGTEQYPVNCISANIEFQATWVPAQVTYLASVKKDNTAYTFDVANSTPSSTTYENNFLIIDKDYSGSITVKSPCTIMMVEPDGSVDYRGKIFSKLITPMVGGNTKIEFAHWQPSGAINARGRNFTIGRGMKMDAETQALYGCNTESVNVDQILKVESGKFTTFSHFYDKKPSRIDKQWVTFGSDYDRAHCDNSKLEFTQRMWVGEGITLPTTSTDEICRVYSLSGKFITSNKVSSASREEIYYLRVRSIGNNGHAYMEILGGEWNSIAGGFGGDDTQKDKPAFTFRMKGGTVNGVVYGAGEYLGASGIRTFVITGGTIKGWVAGGANGTRLTGGDMDGTSYVYVGGNAKINSNNSKSVINRAVGGNVFGAGCGYCNVGTSGEVTLGSNVVVADNSYIERGVYGGGSYGYTNATSSIYITGGTVGGVYGGVKATPTGGTVNDHDEYRASYSSSIPGGVYGGACQNKGGSVNIFMTGGTVNGGIYGGSNASGTLSGNVNIKITDGIVGGVVNGNQTNANVYGGGYGSGTAVNGAVSMTLGNSGASTGATVNGDVYGGGAEGKVNNSISVNINAATINGNLYGGGHGASAKVTNSSTVAMSGGSVNNVFGGGNAAELGGNSTVTIASGNVAGNVYGGGNQAEVKGQTKVIIGNKNSNN